ncbi:sensor histidine kinase [Kitasatospora sp. NPDC058162]|uniref:sensor histidine kinase n=1 Tax=Kitasatospora sp. NPDC058162 TaxID=3346362 RepID=UPI0036DB61A3
MAFKKNLSKENPSGHALLGRSPDLVNRFCARLAQQQSTLMASPASRDRIAVQADGVIADCALTLRLGQAVTSETAARLARAAADPHPTLHADQAALAQASVVLFETVATALQEVVVAEPQGPALLAEALLTLHRSVNARWQVIAGDREAALLTAMHNASNAHRRELARDVHDRVGSSVSLAMRQLELYALSVADRTEAEQKRVLAVRDTLVSTLLELRELITWLREDSSDLDLRSALAAFVESMQVSRTSAVTIDVIGDGAPAGHRTLTELFLVLRECLLNALAHSMASRIDVRVEFTESEVNVLVEDNGIGLDLHRAVSGRRGHGLLSMSERVAQLNGRLAIKDTVPTGTRVDLWIPIGVAEHV